jgi:pyruvate kinase
MLARIAAVVEPTRRRVPVRERYAGVDLAGHMRPEHLVAISVEASLEYLQPVAIVVPSATGATARRIASLHLPTWVVAVSAGEATCQHLQFSYGVTAVHDRATPSARSIEEWTRGYGLNGQFAMLVGRIPPGDPAGNHRMEIITL